MFANIVHTMFLLTFTFGPSCTEFVYPGCWHFDYGATSKIDDVLTEHGGLVHVLPLPVHHLSLTLRVLFWDPSFMGKSYWGVVVGVGGLRDFS